MRSRCWSGGLKKPKNDGSTSTYSTHRGITPKAEGLILDVLYLGLHPSHGEGFQSKLRDKFGMANEFLGYKPLGDDIQTSLLTLA